MPHTDKPNVIVFFTDQQRHDTVGAHGNPLDLTPNLDAAAARGTHVTNAFTPQPICTPARACLQTGQYATSNGCWRNAVPLARDARTVAHLFGENGYSTGYIGKWHLASSPIVAEEERAGYQYWLAANMLEYSSDAYDLVLYDNDNLARKIPGYRVDGITDRAISYIDEHQQEPFFLFVSFLEPHSQNYNDSYPAPDLYEQRFAGRWMPPDLAKLGGCAHQHMGGYLGMVKRLDEAFGRLLDALKSLGLRDNTIVLFTSDHGDHFSTRNVTRKMSPHESSIRVPMVFSGPGFDRGGRVDELVSLIDAAPTLLDAAGISCPDSMQGRSILPLLERGARRINEEPVPWPQEVLIQTSEAELGRAIRTKRWKYGVAAPDKDPKVDINSETYQECCLYDMVNDPYELLNLIQFSGFDRVKQELRSRLLARIVESGEPEPTIVPATNTQQPMGIRSQMFEPLPGRAHDINDPLRYRYSDRE